MNNDTYDKIEAEKILNQLIWVYEHLIEQKEGKLQNFSVIQVLRKTLPAEITHFKSGLNTYNRDKNPKELEQLYRRLSIVHKSVFELLDSRFVFNIRKSIFWIMDVYSRPELRFKVSSLYYQSPLLNTTLEGVMREELPLLKGEPVILYLNGDLEDDAKKELINRPWMKFGCYCGIAGLILIIIGIIMRIFSIEGAGWFTLALGIALLGTGIVFGTQSVLNWIDNDRKKKNYIETMKKHLEEIEPR